MVGRKDDARSSDRNADVADGADPAGNDDAVGESTVVQLSLPKEAVSDANIMYSRIPVSSNKTGKKMCDDELVAKMPTLHS
jgi:hypothetical protein